MSAIYRRQINLTTNLSRKLFWKNVSAHLSPTEICRVVKNLCVRTADKFPKNLSSNFWRHDKTSPFRQIADTLIIFFYWRYRKLFFSSSEKYKKGHFNHVLFSAWPGNGQILLIALPNNQKT